MTDPPRTNPELKSAAKTLEHRSFSTYRSRLAAEKRLRRLGHAWNYSAISSSAATAIASIALLVAPDLYGDNSDTALVIISIAALVLSLATASLQYGARSRNMFVNYRSLQRLSVRAELLTHQTSAVTEEKLKEMLEEYDRLLDDSENHTTFDYYSSIPWKDRTSSQWILVTAGTVATLLPFAVILLPLALMIPLVTWLAA